MCGNFSPALALALLRKASKLRNSWRYRDLTSRGNVDHVMKDVKSPASKSAATGKQGGLNAEIQSRIGHQLRAMYDDVVRQGVPERFAELIRKLDASDAAHQVKADGASGGGANDQ